MNTRTILVAACLAALATLTACSSDTDPDNKPAATASATPDTSSAEAAAGIPPEPTGADREALLLALRAVAPKAVDKAHEDKAIDAARNQCSALNGGAAKPEYLASQRFSYDGVTTSEEQGKAINAALKASGFCKS